jgi:hypothetical protein
MGATSDIVITINISLSFMGAYSIVLLQSDLTHRKSRLFEPPLVGGYIKCYVH